jgi:tetratricopeptide (TPR) repeat protein
MSLINDVRVLTVTAAFLLLPPVFGQRGVPPGGQPPGGNAPGSNPGGGDPSAPGIPGRQQQPQMPQVSPPEQRPIFLSGRVLLDDGTPPPDTVVIQTVCNGMSRTQAYTDGKGRFSFQLGENNNGVFQDASVANPESPFGLPYSGSRQGFGGMSVSINERMMQQCDIEARLPGFQSDSFSLATRKALDNPEIGTIFLHRLAPVEGRVVSATSLAAPKAARKAFEKGQEALKKNDRDKAATHFQTAVQLYPEYAIAWTQLGKVQFARNQSEEARTSFGAAIKAEPKFIDPYIFLALTQAGAKQWKELAQTTDTALRLDPYDYPQAYFLHAVAKYYLGELDAAEKSAREGQAIDKTHRFPKSWHLLGSILAERHDYAGAAEQLRTYLTYAPQAPDAPAVRQQLDQLARK